jgi:hypothetical protein
MQIRVCCKIPFGSVAIRPIFGGIIMYAEKTGMINLDELEVNANEVTEVSGGHSWATNCTYCCPSWMK